MASKAKKKKLTVVLAFHYFRLLYRSVLLILALVWYIGEKLGGLQIVLEENMNTALHVVIWSIFMLEMLLRFFPSSFESPGCQKQFKKNYNPTGRTDVKIHDNNAVMIVAILWIVLNGIFGALRMLHIFDDGIMFLICLVYSVCDIVCILFFCPFQTWILKNRCCSSCRIYNWDYAMMFTPLFFVPGVFTWTLLAASVILLLRWEITVWRYPERFSENTNQYLSCANCTEKLCQHKKQLRGFWVELNKYTDKQIKRILGNFKEGN